MSGVEITQADLEAYEDLMSDDLYDHGPHAGYYFARHRQSATAPLIAALKEAREALARLAYWFDPDTETLAAMDVDTLADHNRQAALINSALLSLTAELAKHKGAEDGQG